MANQDAAFGLRPIGKVGQNDANQGLSEYSVSASSAAIYFQDPVRAASQGTIRVAAAGETLIGSLNGIFFTDANTSKPMKDSRFNRTTHLPQRKLMCS